MTEDEIVIQWRLTDDKLTAAKRELGVRAVTINELRAEVARLTEAIQSEANDMLAAGNAHAEHTAARRRLLLAALTTPPAPDSVADAGKAIDEEWVET